MTRRTKRIVVKCHPEELDTIQAKAISLSLEAATYLRELGLADAESANSEDLVQRQLYWLAGTLQELLASWVEQSTVSLNELELTVIALRQLQQEALLDKLPPSQLNANFTQAIAQVQNAYQRHQGE